MLNRRRSIHSSYLPVAQIFMVTNRETGRSPPKVPAIAVIDAVLLPPALQADLEQYRVENYSGSALYVCVGVWNCAAFT